MFSFPGIEKRVSLAYAREKIKARRKSSLKKSSAQETVETDCEPLQFVEFFGDHENNSIIEDDFTEDIIYSEDEDDGKYQNSDVYSDEKGYKYSVIDIQNKTRYAILKLFKV